MGLGLALPAGAAADGPPYSDGSIPDGIEACSGNPYEFVERDGDLYVRCQGTLANDWRVFTTTSAVTPAEATITISRAHARGPALIAYETQPGTATASVDYLATSGRVYVADGQTTATIAVPRPALPPPPGTPARSFTVTFTDPVSLGLTVPTVTIELPATAVPPEAPTIDAGPTATTPLRRATFAFSGEPGATFQCRIDAQAFQLCAGPRTFSNIAVGSHRFEVRQRDGDDGPWSSVAGYDWTVAGSPDPGFPSGPPYNTGRLDGDNACDGGLYDIVAVQGDRYLRCLGGGGHDWQRFSATATVSGSTATVTLTRAGGEDAPALVEFRTMPGSAVAGTDYTAIEGELVFRAGVTTRTLQIPIVRHPGATADRSFGLALSDPVGASLSLPQVTVTVPADPAPPTISSGPASPTVLSTASFGFTGESDASFECRLDDAAFAACTSPKAYSGVDPGEHRFEVRQRASHGALSEPIAREWTVLPSPDPGSPVGPPYAANRTPDGEYACDGGFYTVPTHNGDRYVRCLGAYGYYDWQKVTATVTVGVDSATVTLTRGAVGAPALIGFTTEPGTAEADVDFTPISGELYFRDTVTTRTLTIPIVRDPAASSDRDFAVRLTDPVNVGLALPPVNVMIPGNPPTETAAPTIGGTARVGEQLTATDGGWTHEPTSFAYAWLRCDAAGDGCLPIVGATAADHEPTAADAGARLRVEVTATNGSGSAVARSAASAVVRPALAAPTITAGPTGEQILHRAQLGFSGEPDATFECRLDDGAFAPCTSPRTLTQLPSGERRFEVRQRATDGVVSTAAVREWTVLPAPDPGYPLAPPYGHVTDGYRDCFGSPFDTVSHNGDIYAVCYGGPAELPWQRFAASTAVEGDTATVTITRGDGHAAALLGIATRDGTATAGRDYAARSGELYFAPGVASRTIEIPVVRDADATSDRAFTVTLRDALEANLQVADATVTIPGNPPTANTPPTIDGVVRVGHTITATDGDWTHQPTGYARSWERCADGVHCVSIDDATGATYEPDADDVGHRLRVTVTATNGSGTTVDRSQPTAAVRAALAAPTVTGGPGERTEETSATFAFAGESGATFECRRDDEAFAACTSPVTYGGLGLGEQWLAVRQVADDGVVSPEAIRRWTVVKPADPDGPGDGGGEHPPGSGGGAGGGGENGSGPGGTGAGGGEHPPSGGPGGQPPAGGSPTTPGAPAKRPVRMTTIGLELRFCAGCTTPSARDRKRLERLRSRVGGSRLLAIDGYGDRGRSRAQNRRLARSRARAVERILVAGAKPRPARRTVVGHDRLTRVESAKTASATRKRAAVRIVTVRVVRRR